MATNRLIQKARLAEIYIHNEILREFVFEMQNPEALKFRAGQFLMLHIPPPIEGEKDILRAYSLASGEQNPSRFRLLIKYIENGIASKYFWQLNKDQTIHFTAPFGKLFFPENPSPQLYFLSTGSGLAPHLSYIETHLDRFPNCQFQFLIGVRTQSDIFYADYLNSKMESNLNFKFEFVLSRPDKSWNGRIGYLQKQIETLSFNNENCHFFICGNENMAKETKKLLLNLGVDGSKILVEIF